MIVLGIETATPVCSVGLGDGANLLAETSENAGRRHSVVLVDMVDHVLAEAKISRDRLEGVAISAGPGSFTGLRIGMGLAKGICLAMDIPLLTVSTLQALIQQSGESGTVCGCLDARHDELYSGVYDAHGVNIHPDAGRDLETLLPLIDEATVVGYEIGAYAKVLPELGRTVLPDVRPSGGSVAHLGHDLLASGKQTPLDLAVPNYCKKSQPERLRAKQGKA